MSDDGEVEKDKFRLTYVMPEWATAEQASEIEKILDGAIKKCAKVLGGQTRSRNP